MAGQGQQGTGKHGHKDTQEPYPHRETQQGKHESGGHKSEASRSGSQGGSEDLKEREYRDSQANVHHHTKTYEEQHGKSEGQHGKK